MSVVKIYPENFESFTVQAHPHRTYTSSSSGVTGSVKVFPRASSIEREFPVGSAFVDSKFKSRSAADMLRSAQVVSKQSGVTDVSSNMSEYMDEVGDLEVSSRNSATRGIDRITLGAEFTSDNIKKLIVRDLLNPYYRVDRPTCNWAYTNYNCLSFFTASNLPTDAVLLYPNVPDESGVLANGLPATGRYMLTGAFTFDFHINPRYNGQEPNTPFHAGTILHLSSCYALSLVSGSVKDEQGNPETFKLLLQLTHSADVAPDECVPGSDWANSHAFESDDCVIRHNRWHHCVVRWGTDTMNNGTGSFLVDYGDGFVSAGTFVVPSSSLIFYHHLGGAAVGDPRVLCLGNFYRGDNSKFNTQLRFFSVNSAVRDGLIQLSAHGANVPTRFWFSNPLNADLHDISIIRRYASDYELSQSSGHTPRASDMEDHVFYVSPFFIRESPLRKSYLLYGGILQSPFYEIDGTTTDPFNVALSFGCLGHDINLENFVKDVASNLDPRCLHLTGAAITTTTDARTANEFLWDDQPCLVKRNMLIMPCDDGNFSPDWRLLSERDADMSYLYSVPNDADIVDDGESLSKFVDDIGTQDLSIVSLRTMVSESSRLFGYEAVSVDSTTGEDTRTSGFTDELVGIRPEQIYSDPGSAFTSYEGRVTKAITDQTFSRSTTMASAPYTVYQRTQDPSSNEIVMFDVSNLLYGNRIHPGSLYVTDPSLSGSGGVLSVTLRDDGYGGLYRADCSGSHAKWNNVGNVYYDEGIVLIKSPHLFQFGKHEYEFDFKGEQSVHVSTYDVVASANTVNSSSNPAFQVTSASLYANDNDNEFVWISGINWHDENMNVVMRTQLAQPVMKRHGSRIMFRVRTDY